MINRIRARAFILLAIFVIVGHASAADSDGISAEKLKTHCYFLASDTLEGREAGTTGGRAAAAYLRQQFETIGLEPAAGDGDYFQEFGRGYRNIIGVLRGGDPELSRDYVILGAHYDHVGYARRGNAYGPIGRIHNGADDNASGTAAILEIARVIAAMEPPPKRSVLFVLWDAEEIGLDGSEHWIRVPTVRKDRVRLSINIDMVGRLREETINVRGVRTIQGLRWLLAGANLETDLTLDFAWGHKADSDHYPFYQSRIPYLCFDTGKHEDYHRPSDDAHRLNFDGLQRVSELLLRTVVTAADRDELPRFRRESINEALRSDDWFTRTRPEFPTRLGLGWHRRSDISAPVRTRRITPGLPADAAGVRVGDTILSFNGQDTAGRNDLAVQVAMAESPVELVIQRDGENKPTTLSVDLAGAPLPWGILTREDPAEPNMPVVVGILSRSPAEAAGVEPGDRLIVAFPEEYLRSNPQPALFSVREGGNAPSRPIIVERHGRIERLDPDVANR
jgi:hypothetical protein